MRRFVIVVKPDMDLQEFVHSAAYGHKVEEDEIRKRIGPYIKNGKLTIVFDLDGMPPSVLPNGEKGKTCTQTPTST